MAAKPGAASTTYSPIDPTNKTRPPIFTGSDIDWLRPDSRTFQQCRPACKLTLFVICLFYLLKMFFYSYVLSFIWIYIIFLYSLLSRVFCFVLKEHLFEYLYLDQNIFELIDHNWHVDNFFLFFFVCITQAEKHLFMFFKCMLTQCI